MDKLIEIAYSESHEELKLESHYHNSYEIIYIVEGESIFEIDKKEYSAVAGSLIFINSFETHRIKVTNLPYKRYFILIDPVWLQLVINDPVLISVFKNRPPHYKHMLNLDIQKQDLAKDFFDLLYMEFINKPKYWELELKSSLQKLFVFLYRNCEYYFPLKSYGPSIELTSKIQKYLEENCIHEVSLKKVSQLFFVDMYYLSHLFKQNTGFAFKEYLILLRISKAKELLINSNDNITTVCLNSGFNNVNHFIRIFKKYTNTTPLKYRKTNKPKQEI